MRLPSVEYIIRIEVTDIMKKILKLFLTFLKIGAFTFGGGYAMIALLEHEFIDKKGWLDRDEFLDMTAIAESTPCPIATNSATYIGYRIAGIAGAAVSTLAVCIPSFVVIYIISIFFDRFLEFRYVAYAFRGIQVCVVYLISSVGIGMLKTLKKDVFTSVILILVIILNIVFAIFSVNFSSIFFILISGVAGIGFYIIRRIMGKGDSDDALS